MNRPIWRHLAIAATVVAVAALVCATPASAAEESHLLVDVAAQGQGFTSDPHGPLLDMQRLAPGRSTSGLLGVRNNSDDDASLTMGVNDVVDDDHGCNVPEARVDHGCGPGDGELSQQLVMDISTADRAGGDFVSVWQGSLSDLAADVDAAGTLAAHQTRWIRLTASLPESSGNETQTDLVGFGVRVGLSFAGGDESIAVEGTKVGRADPGLTSVLGRVVGGLPRTGGMPLTAAFVGLSLLALGVVLRRRNVVRA